MMKTISLRNSPLTPRWTSLNPNESQREYVQNLIGVWEPTPKGLKLHKPAYRWNVNPSGRRSGKTEYGKRALIWTAGLADMGGRLLNNEHTPEEVMRFAMAAPTRDQAKDIFWLDLKKMVPRAWITGISETKLAIRLKHGTEVMVVGMDRPERIEGSPLDGILCTEFGNFKEDAYGEHIRPALSTIGRPGFGWFEGTPEGRNFYFDLVEGALEQPDEWGYAHWPSWEIIDPAEVEAAKRDLDELTFRQEYGGEFLSMSGRVYYAFDRDKHIDDRAVYDKLRTVSLCFDFNVEPGVCAVVQELDLGRDGERVTAIIDEVYILKNSNTPRVCQEIIERYRGHHNGFHIFADASGGARHTSQVAGSDLDLIEEILGESLRHVTFKVPKANPAERSRVNAVNSRLCSTGGVVSVKVHPRCTHMIKDLEGVEWGAGNKIEKKKTPSLTHISDGFGYREAYLYPVRKITTSSRSLF